LTGCRRLTIFVVPTMYTRLARKHALRADKRTVSEAATHPSGLPAR
jgi:hypothetical protein